MKTTLTGVLLVFTILLSYENYSQTANSESSENAITAEDLRVLLGEWTGSLTYIDYSSNKPYTMPANLIVKEGKDQNQLLLFNIYPNEPKANNQDKIVLAKNGRQLNKKEVKSKRRMTDGQLQITTEFLGKDNKKKAFIRNVYILGNKQFIIRKEVKFENSDEWLKRNEFNYKR